VPCNYSDYQTATKGDLPERYISTISKFLWSENFTPELHLK
jgi:hypothetical protein